MDWAFPSQLWFIEWGMEALSRENPKAAIAVIHEGQAICGFVPNDWRGETLAVETKCPIG